ncbi:MAG: hypothetical protein IKK24_04415 [Clostridia bacterium]|nr:hypothetical protein [Clostridia bacterium]
MVKKLFKHEIFAFVRTLTPLYIALLGVAFCGRFIQFFENDSTPYKIISGTSILIYVVAIFASMLLTSVYSVVRFYKHLYSGEGYLTFTLPITVTQHITVKLFVALLFQFITLLSVIVSVCVITAGELLIEIGKALGYLLDMLTMNMNYHLVIIIAEIIIALVIMTIYEYMLIYSCISVGQLSNKNRIIWAIGAYFAYYIATQIIGTVVVILVMVLEKTLALEKIAQFIARHPFASAHIIICGVILIFSALSAVFFFVNKSIMTKKLNLE